jgi:ribosomal protein S27AE
VYGRRPIELVVKDGQAFKRQRSACTAQDAKVFIADHHEGYIRWDAYQRHQDTMRGNGANFIRDDAAAAVRSGQGLLTGLLRCARAHPLLGQTRHRGPHL